MYDVKDFTSRHRVRCRKHTQQPDPLISPTIAAKMPVAGESAIHHDIRLAGAIIRIQRASADTLGARGDSSIMHLLKLTLAIFAIFTPQPPPHSECSRLNFQAVLWRCVHIIHMHDDSLRSFTRSCSRRNYNYLLRLYLWNGFLDLGAYTAIFHLMYLYIISWCSDFGVCVSVYVVLIIDIHY